MKEGHWTCCGGVALIARWEGGLDETAPFSWVGRGTHERDFDFEAFLGLSFCPLSTFPHLESFACNGLYNRYLPFRGIVLC